MGPVTDYFSFEIALGAFIALFIVGRVMSRSALKLLDDEAKVRLVDASARSNWWWIPFLLIIAVFFMNIEIGAIALFVYLAAAIGYNVVWAMKNGMPGAYVRRIAVANGLILTGFVVLGLGYAVL